MQGNEQAPGVRSSPHNQGSQALLHKHLFLFDCPGVPHLENPFHFYIPHTFCQITTLTMPNCAPTEYHDRKMISAHPECHPTYLHQSMTTSFNFWTSTGFCGPITSYCEVACMPRQVNSTQNNLHNTFCVQTTSLAQLHWFNTKRFQARSVTTARQGSSDNFLAQTATAAGLNKP